MVSELSILVPVYNRDVTSLVEELHRQASQLTIPFEIRVYDDGSSQNFLELNRRCRSLGNVVYAELPQNIGRSKIRYRLAEDAQFDFLLFLDNDVLPAQPNFLETYVRQTQAPVCAGGVSYRNDFPPEAI